MTIIFFVLALLMLIAVVYIVYKMYYDTEDKKELLSIIMEFTGDWYSKEPE